MTYTTIIYNFFIVTPFPKTFLAQVKVIFTRIFRIYAIIYSQYFSKLERMGAVPHLNTAFKHFMYFVWEFGLVVPAELEASKDVVAEVRMRYDASRNEEMVSIDGPK
jgi:MOB kinase activator 1